MTSRNDLHFKLVFFDFDVRLTDACSEADFVEVKTGGSLLKVYNCLFLRSLSAIAWFAMKSDRPEIQHYRVYDSDFQPFSSPEKNVNDSVLFLFKLTLLSTVLID